MKAKRRFYSFINFQPPQRSFIMMQFIILASMMLFLLYSSFEVFRTFQATYKSIGLSQQQAQLYFSELYKALLVQITIVFCGGFLINVLFGLFFLHRLTGPLVRVRHVLNQIADGQFPNGMVRFRKDDFLNEIAIALSRLIDFLNRLNVPMKSEKDKTHGHSTH